MRNSLLMGDAEKKISLPLHDIHNEASRALWDIKALLPPQYKLTLVARNTELDNADLVISEDGDHDAVKRALDTSTVKRGVV